MDYKFEWDERKNKTNALRHGVTFEEARTVFADKNAVTFYDEKHSEDEERFIIIGRNVFYRELAVCHCYRDDDVVRIISARKANKNEIELYYGGRQL